MTTRLDRLLLLLDTGSSTSVRNTAAKQLAQLATKSVIADVAFDDHVKSPRHQTTTGDSSAWAELMAVVARIIPYLHSKSFETRTAASVALSHISLLVPVWQPTSGPYNGTIRQDIASPDFPSFSVEDLIAKGKLLLASSGKEFSKPSGILSSSEEVKRARKEAMGRLGLEFLEDVADDLDLDREFAKAADADENMAPLLLSSTGTDEIDLPRKDTHADGKISDNERSQSPSLTPVHPSLARSALPIPDSQGELIGMSARERNRLKRKRKLGNLAYVTAPPPQSSGSKYHVASSGTSKKARLVASEDDVSSQSRIGSPIPPSAGMAPEKVVVDPSKGGAISPKVAKQSKALEVDPGCWVWDGVVKVLEVDLFSAAWEVRHGAAMALRELLKVQGKHGGKRDGVSAEENDVLHEKWCNDLAAKFLCVFVLDRFGDFVSDQVVAPVRETVSQTLASLMIHMPRRSLLKVHDILLQMVRQEFTASSDSEKTHVWEVRHAGLLGIKYEVAVRNDLFASDQVNVSAEGKDLGRPGRHLLYDVVDAAILGLDDQDDDVRAVAASCISPVAWFIVDRIPDVLDRILVVLWHCLCDMKDDLNSSVGSVMDLLGKLVTYEQVIDIIGDKSKLLPSSTLAQSLFPFFRHTIPNVRLAVVKTLASFMTVRSLPRDWIATPFLCLLFQNLISEERCEIRDATMTSWRTAVSVLASTPNQIEAVITERLILDWFAVMMTPIGVAVDTSSFYHPSTTQKKDDTESEKHNVDKNMLTQDLSLVTVESTIKARVVSCSALAYLMKFWPTVRVDSTFRPILLHYIDSTSMLQKFLSAIVAEEWARECDDLLKTESTPVTASLLAQALNAKLHAWLQGDPLPVYHEMAFALKKIHLDCIALLQGFATDCKLPMSSIPTLGCETDTAEINTGSFTIDVAQSAIGAIYSRLKSSLGRTKRKEVARLDDKRTKVLSDIDRFIETKSQYDIRVSAAFAAAFVALRSTPDKVSPIVKGIMNGIKNEENFALQNRSAVAVASFVKFCTTLNFIQPPEKIVKNLCTFLCQDIEQTPTFSSMQTFTDGILSFQSAQAFTQTRASKDVPKDKIDLPMIEKVRKSWLSRRGAVLAFVQLSATFGANLFDAVPSIWQSMAGGLLSTFPGDSPEQSDILILKQFGQDVIDSLSVLDAVMPTIHEELWPRFTRTFTMMQLALRSRYAIIRQSAAKCFATICEVMTSEAMRYIVENVIPLLGDPLVLPNRQGAMELIYHIVQKLDIKALPYVIFLVVPVLGRMSDPNDDIRSTATNTFASLVKMVPLEAGLPDPLGFPDELLKRRDIERQFLAQLLDGSKVEQYEMPITVKTELRKYQQDGVSWLAFLAKYQLHGILCDDMGLGKTLQTICILASKHFERKQKFGETQSPDSVPLSSLIVCPPTLTGHWYYEILKYVDNLRPVLYTGSTRERMKLLPQLKAYDVIITSYEVVRNDITHLDSMNWLYTVLDEGHIIKNAKTKLTKAVKCIHAQHRIILSGTPIQNNVLELWSLFDFLMPGFLGSESFFNERFGKPILSNRDGKAKNGEGAALALEALHKQVLPFILRRLKEDVLHDLPPKIIQDYYCELSDLQKYLYDDFAKSRAHVSTETAVQASGGSGKGEGSQQHIFQSLQYLRKLCNHPALVLNDNQTVISAALAKIGTRSEGLTDIQHAPKLQALSQLLLDCGIGCPQSVVTDSGKSELIDAITVTDGAFSQHRVLIFCQMKRMLDIIESDLFKKHMPSVTYMRLDGGTDANKRHAIVQTFNSDPSIDCLLLTTHVGGLGLTLTGADTVIFVEHDWNPMKDLQAMDRAHRIGQKKVVNVYRLITKGTLEEKIMGLQRFKLNIANSVVTQQNAGLSSMDTDLVFDLFRWTTQEEDALAAAKKKARETCGPVSQSRLLQSLEDLPTEEEYDGLDLSSFIGSLGL